MASNKERIEQLEVELAQSTTIRLNLRGRSRRISRVAPHHHSGRAESSTPMFQSKFAKLEFPRFAVGDPTMWLTKVKQFFDYQETPGTQKVQYAAYHLEDEANEWWQATKRAYAEEETEITWEVFEEELWARFGPLKGEDFDEALSKIKQPDFPRLPREFERLVNKVRGWTQKALVGMFMEAISLARMKDEQLQRQRRTQPNTPQIQRNTQQNSKGPLTTKRLGWEEICKKRSLGLCFAIVMSATPDINAATTLLLMEGDENRTMRIYEQIGQHQLVALIDSGSTHNFIGEKMATMLQLSVVPTGLFRTPPISPGHALFAIYATEEGNSTPVPQELKELIELPPQRDIEHQITLEEGTDPINVRPYRYAYFQKDEIERQVSDMLNWVDSPGPVHSLHQGALMISNSYREDMDELHGAAYFTKLDLTAGYHQVRLHPPDIYKTAFRTHNGHYEYLVMPFGLCNAPSTFQALMNSVFRPFLRKFVLVFFDDILVYSSSWQEHLQHVKTIFELLRQHQLFVKFKKCEFGKHELEYLGHIISADGVKVDQSKIQAMLDWPRPTTVTELRAFLGLTGYYRKFVHNYGIIARALTNLLKKGKFQWDEAAKKAFENLKAAMTTTPTLALPDFSSPFVIQTDASGDGIGAVLSQNGRPIAFMSRALGVSKQSLSTYAREISKWMSKLVGYDYEIVYKPGKPTKRNFIGPLCAHHQDAWRLAILLPLPIPCQVWDDITMDFIDGLPRSDGKTSIMVVVDRLSKSAHFIAIAHPYTAKTIANKFVEGVVKLHGMPRSIISDRDPVFISNFWQEFLKLSGTKLRMTSAYHPQSDGQTEVVNRCIEQYLRCFVHHKPRHWNSLLPWAEYWYNTTYHSSLE
ncbi:hypothetical protein AAG906_013681 [Vitis piasezkii]